MDGPQNNKAAGVATPAALDCYISKSKVTPKSKTPQPGSKGAAVCLGTALRHARQAQTINIRRGPCALVASEIRHARHALDSAEWVCGYVEAER